MKRPRHLHPMRWLILALASIFYYYEYVLRVSPSVMIPELERAFGVSVGVVGTVSAFYFYAYAILQLPVGILMDRYGARKLLVFAAAICGIGGIAFGFTRHLALVETSRFLMGTGSAFAFIGMIYICHHWFPNRWVALLIGLGNSVGMLGAVTGEGPLSLGVKTWGFRPVAIALGGIGLILSGLIYGLMKREPAQLKKQIRIPHGKELLQQLKGVLSSGPNWINACGNMFFYATVVAFAALWGVPFITTAYQVSTAVAAFAASMVYVGFIVGGPLVGLISDQLKRRKVPLLFTSLFGFFSLTPVIYLNQMPIELVYLFLFLTGVCSSGTLLNFPVATSLNPPEAKGTALAVTNTVAFLGGAFFQFGIGKTLQTVWGGVEREGVTYFSVEAYQGVLSFFPISFLLAFILFTFLKEPMRGRSTKERNGVENPFRP